MAASELGRQAGLPQVTFQCACLTPSLNAEEGCHQKHRWAKEGLDLPPELLGQNQVQNTKAAGRALILNSGSDTQYL